MSARGHILFSVAMLIFAKKIKITSVLDEGVWGHVILGAILGCLLPDIDHPQSWIGQKIKFFSKTISKIFGHRGFTHSVIFVLIFIVFINFNTTVKVLIPSDLMHAAIYGYISHILADMLTPSGVPLLWPLRWRFRFPILYCVHGSIGEYIFCIILLVLSILYPININVISHYSYLIYKFFFN